MWPEDELIIPYTDSRICSALRSFFLDLVVKLRKPFSPLRALRLLLEHQVKG